MRNGQYVKGGDYTGLLVTVIFCTINVNNSSSTVGANLKFTFTSVFYSHFPIFVCKQCETASVRGRTERKSG